MAPQDGKQLLARRPQGQGPILAAAAAGQLHLAQHELPGGRGIPAAVRQAADGALDAADAAGGRAQLAAGLLLEQAPSGGGGGGRRGRGRRAGRPRRGAPLPARVAGEKCTHYGLDGITMNYGSFSGRERVGHIVRASHRYQRRRGERRTYSSRRRGTYQIKYYQIVVC